LAHRRTSDFNSTSCASDGRTLQESQNSPVFTLRTSTRIRAAVLTAAFGTLTSSAFAQTPTSLQGTGTAPAGATATSSPDWSPRALLDRQAAAAGQATPGATATTAAPTPLADRFQFDAGYFGIDANTVLRYNGPDGGSGEVNFEDDLGVRKDATTLWVDATMRLGRRHQVKVSYTKLDRDRAGFKLDRTFTWGGETYAAGLDATTTTGTDILGAYYRFAVYRNDRFEVGPSVGLGYLWLSAGIRATGTVSGPGGSESRSLDESATLGSVTGAIGGYSNAWLTNRLVLRADYLYIKISPDNSDASVTDWRVGADYYFLSHVGIGAQYKYYEYTYDRGAFDSRLGGNLRYDGFQVFASFLF
jgi:hypothetical protein